MSWEPKDYFDNGRTVAWGKDLSKKTLAAMDNGEVFTLLGKDGKPHSMLCRDSYGTLRESPKESWEVSKPFLGLRELAE